MDEVPHTLDAVRVSQHLANYLVDTARQSSHKPESHEEELAMLIYSTPPTFSARFEIPDDDNYDGPDITYYFDEKENPPDGPDDGPTAAAGRQHVGGSRSRRAAASRVAESAERAEAAKVFGDAVYRQVMPVKRQYSKKASSFV